MKIIIKKKIAEHMMSCVGSCQGCMLITDSVSISVYVRELRLLRLTQPHEHR